MRLLTLKNITTSFALLGALDPRFEKYGTDELSMRDHIDLLPPLDGSLTDFTRYCIYKKFIEWSGYESYCKNELKDLANVLSIKDDLEQGQIQLWFLRNSQLFLDKLFGVIMECDSVEDTKEYFYLNTDEYLEKKDFRSVLDFCEIMNLLYFKEYHLPIAERTTPHPNDYYYSEPDLNEPSDLEKVKTIIESTHKI